MFTCVVQCMLCCGLLTIWWYVGSFQHLKTLLVVHFFYMWLIAIILLLWLVANNCYLWLVAIISMMWLFANYFNIRGLSPLCCWCGLYNNINICDLSPFFYYSCRYVLFARCSEFVYVHGCHLPTIWSSTLYLLLSVVYVFVVPLKWMLTTNKNKLSWVCNYLWIKLRHA